LTRGVEKIAAIETDVQSDQSEIVLIYTDLKDKQDYYNMNKPKEAPKSDIIFTLPWAGLSPD
jgi:hypothetical protein